MVDFLGNFRTSAQRGQPVYRLGGGPGFFWAASYDQTGRGNLRFGAANISAFQQSTEPKSAAATSAAPFDPSKLEGVTSAAESKAVASQAAPGLSEAAVRHGPVAPATEIVAHWPERLIHPAAGFKPFRIVILNGLPFLTAANVDGRGDDNAGFFRLLALSIRPELIEKADVLEDSRDWPLDYAKDFLQEGNKLVNYNTKDWAGKTNEEKFDARDIFIKSYAVQIRGIAPKFPLEFYYSYDFALPTYNHDHRGFDLPDSWSMRLADVNPGNVRIISDVKLQSLVWPITQSDSEAVLARLKKEQSSLLGADYSRTVRVAFLLEATQPDPENLSFHIRLKNVALYNRALSERLYETTISGTDQPPDISSLDAEKQSLITRDLARFKDELNEYVKSNYDLDCLSKNFVLARMKSNDLASISDHLLNMCIDESKIQVYALNKCHSIYQSAYPKDIDRLCACYSRIFAKRVADNPSELENSRYEAHYLGPESLAACKR